MCVDVNTLGTGERSARIAPKAQAHTHGQLFRRPRRPSAKRQVFPVDLCGLPLVRLSLPSQTDSQTNLCLFAARTFLEGCQLKKGTRMQHRETSCCISKL